MRRALAAICLLCSVRAGAQSPVWAVQGAHNTVYLAESVHLLKSDESTLPAAFARAYASSRTIVMELDLSHLDADTMQAWMLQHGLLPGDTTLRDAVGEQLYQRAATEAGALGVPIETLQKFEPWVVALMLSDLEYLKLGYDPDQGVEHQVESWAERDGKEIRGLETLDEELGQLEHLSSDDQSRFLDLTVDEMQDAKHDTDDLLAAWRAGDTDKLADLLSSNYQTFPDLYRALVTDRNARWVTEIEGYLKDDHDYLVIVGALHVVGPGGLIERVRRDGYTVTPVLAGPQ
jgi:uncharacterized protein